MANRFPLIVDSSGVAALKELPSGDNLDLTGNGIVGAGTVALTNLTVGGSQGTDGQVLTSTGSGVAWADAAGGGGAWNVVSSTTVSSAVAYIEFTISGYDSYEIRFSDINDFTMNGVSRNLQAYFSTNGGTSYSSNCNWVYTNTSTRSTGSGITNSGGLTGYVRLSDIYGDNSSSNDYALSGSLTLENNSSSSSQKHGDFRVIHSRDYNNLDPHIKRGDYGVKETSPINKIKLSFDATQSGQAQFNIPAGSKFTLYGLATS